MKLYLIRHAESVNNALYSRTGGQEGRVPDPDITEIGHQQAQRLARLLADESAEPRKTLSSKQTGFGLTHLYCSLMTRTIQTGSYIAEACGLKLITLNNTFERGGIYQINEHGIPVGLPGPGRYYFMDRFPKLILPESIGQTGWYNRPFETESMFVQRMKKAVREIINRHAGTEHSVALVAHGHFIDQFVNELMRIERHTNNYTNEFKLNWKFHNASISRIEFVDGATIVVYLNRIDHLSADLVTK